MAWPVSSVEAEGEDAGRQEHGDLLQRGAEPPGGLDHRQRGLEIPKSRHTPEERTKEAPAYGHWGSAGLGELSGCRTGSPFHPVCGGQWLMAAAVCEEAPFHDRDRLLSRSFECLISPPARCPHGVTGG